MNGIHAPAATGPAEALIPGKHAHGNVDGVDQFADKIKKQDMADLQETLSDKGVEDAGAPELTLEQANAKLIEGKRHLQCYEHARAMRCLSDALENLYVVFCTLYRAGPKTLLIFF